MGYLLNGPVTAVLVVIGVIFNLCSMYIFLMVPRRVLSSYATHQTKLPKSERGHQRLMKRSTASRPLINTYLLWLAISDTALLLSATLMYCIPTFLDSLGNYARFFPTYYLLSNASLTASVWLMCVLMFERYRALCRPLDSHVKQLNLKRVHRTLCVVSLLALLFSLPRLFEISVLEVDGKYHVHQTLLVETRSYMIGYRIIGGLLFYSLLPYIVLFIISARISLALHAANKQRQSLAASLRSTRNADSELVLIAVMAKFLISRSMPTALDLAEHIVSSREFLNSTTATFFVDISNLIVVLSSATNFFVYFSLSAAFRRTVFYSFLRPCSRRTVFQERRRHFAVRRHPTNDNCHRRSLVNNATIVTDVGHLLTNVEVLI